MDEDQKVNIQFRINTAPIRVERDADFVAYARSHIQLLLGEVDRIKEIIKKLEQDIYETEC